MDGSGGLKDDEDYYWRVIAVDLYGGRGYSDATNPPFSFRTNDANIDRGVIFATVTNALSEATLAGAVVTAKKEGTQTTVSPLASSYLGGGLLLPEVSGRQV